MNGSYRDTLQSFFFNRGILGITSEFHILEYILEYSQMHPGVFRAISKNVVPRLESSSSPESLWEMQILGPLPSPAESEIPA